MGTFEGKSADQWRDESAEQLRRKYESQDRCDTDGFMSQWASDLMAREYEYKARLAETDGWWEFPALFDLEGWLVPAKLFDGQYGTSWAILEDDDPRSRIVKFVGRSTAMKAVVRNKNMRKKGYIEGVVRARARVEMRGGSITSVTPVIVRDDGGFSRAVEVVSTEATEDWI